MNEIRHTKQNYTLINEEGETLSATFCGKVAENLVQVPQEFKDKKINTIMGFYSKIKSKGYGKSLLNKLIEIEIERGTQILTLGVSKDNEIAIKLYEGCGFVISGDLSMSDKYHFMYLDLTV